MEAARRGEQLWWEADAPEGGEEEEPVRELTGEKAAAAGRAAERAVDTWSVEASVRAAEPCCICLEVRACRSLAADRGPAANGDGLRCPGVPSVRGQRAKGCLGCPAAGLILRLPG